MPDLPAVRSDGGGLTRPGWIRVNPGTFMMGSPAQDPCRQDDEQQHKVTLTRAFEMQITEVTQDAFSKAMSRNPSSSVGKQCGSACPVDSVSWDQAAAYCNALSKQHGVAACYDCSGDVTMVSCSPNWKYNGNGKKIYDCPGFRLPTEAEWEYAYRAGTQTMYYNGNVGASGCLDCYSAGAPASALGWMCANAGGAPHPVKQKLPNPWGIHDLGGNIREWTDDWYVKTLPSGPVTDPWRATKGPTPTKVLRGGGYLDAPRSLRGAHRHYFEPKSTSTAYIFNGFRCVRTLP